MTLTRRTPLRRTGPPERKTRLRSVGRRVQREAGARAAFKAAVHARVWCEGNAVTCSELPHPGVHAHHIFPGDRDLGIHDPERGLLLCPLGHSYVHRHPEWSYVNGYLGRAS